MNHKNAILPALALLSVALSACGSNNNSASVAANIAPTVTASVPSVVQREVIEVSGNAKDSDGTIKTVVVKVNDKAVTATLNNDAYTANVELKAGPNTITVTATDNAGKETIAATKTYLGHVVAAGNSHSGIVKAGALYTWGRNNFGQTGLGFYSTLKDSKHPSSPTKVGTPASFVALSFNQNQSAAIAAGGALYTWGDDTGGQLGRGAPTAGSCGATLACRLDMGQVAGLPAIAQVSVGYSHTLALGEDGSVWGFGLNSSGQLGDASGAAHNTPVKIALPGAGRIVQVLASSASSYALDDKGQVWGWGRNMYGNLGQNAVNDAKGIVATPVKVIFPADTVITQIAAGRDHVLALTKDGKVYGWGLNASSQVGNNGVNFKGKADAWPGNVLTPRLISVTLTGDQKVTDVYANGNTSYLRLSDGSLRAWGMYGDTAGSGATAYANLDAPSDKPGNLKDISDLAVGALHQVAQRNDGQLFSWGWSFEGSLGGGSTTLDTWMYNAPISLTLP